MHTTITCLARILMLEDQGDSNPTANAAYAPPDSRRIQADTGIRIISDATEYSDVNSLFASTFNQTDKHLEAKDAVASDMMALKQA